MAKAFRGAMELDANLKHDESLHLIKTGQQPEAALPGFESPALRMLMV